MKKWELARFVLVLAFILFLYLSLITRLFYWQIIRAEELKELGERQSSEVFRVPAVRGEIFSSDNFPLATNTVSHILYSNPKVVKDKEKSSEILSTLLFRGKQKRKLKILNSPVLDSSRNFQDFILKHPWPPI